MEKQIYQIYDRIFKRIFSLSNLAIISLINGLFGTNYPPDSEVEYPNKEYISATLSKRLADLIILIQGVAYHLEAQMKEDGTIVMRAFEYGFHYAMSAWDGGDVLRFPEPVIIYLDTDTEVPEISTLTLQFGEQRTFSFEVKNFVYQDHDITELNRKKMIALIPFQLLKLRKIIAEEPTKENFERLKSLILNDIIGSIKANVQMGNITTDDANQLKELTEQLYEHIYQHYTELGGYDDMKPLLDGALELPLDKYRLKIDELEKEKLESERRIEEIKKEKDEEIRKLKIELATLKNK